MTTQAGSGMPRNNHLGYIWQIFAHNYTSSPWNAVVLQFTGLLATSMQVYAYLRNHAQAHVGALQLLQCNAQGLCSGACSEWALSGSYLEDASPYAYKAQQLGD